MFYHLRLLDFLVLIVAKKHGPSSLPSYDHLIGKLWICNCRPVIQDQFQVDGFPIARSFCQLWYFFGMTTLKHSSPRSFTNSRDLPLCPFLAWRRTLVSKYLSFRSWPKPSEIAFAKSRIIDSPWIAKELCLYWPRSTVFTGYHCVNGQNPEVWRAYRWWWIVWRFWVWIFGFSILSLAMGFCLLSPFFSFSLIALSAGIDV